MKADILSRKDQVDTMDNNKNELWIRQVTMKAEVIIIRKSQIVEETTLLDRIQRNQIKEQEVQK